MYILLKKLPIFFLVMSLGLYGHVVRPPEVFCEFTCILLNAGHIIVETVLYPDLDYLWNKEVG